MSNQIDARGLSCPEPVLLMHTALQNSPSEVSILADCEASKENISRAAKKQNYTATIRDINSTEFEIILRKN